MLTATRSSWNRRSAVELPGSTERKYRIRSQKIGLLRLGLLRSLRLRLLSMARAWPWPVFCVNAGVWCFGCWPPASGRLLAVAAWKVSREKPEAAADRKAKPEDRTGEDFRGEAPALDAWKGARCSRLCRGMK